MELICSTLLENSKDMYYFDPLPHLADNAKGSCYAQTLENLLSLLGLPTYTHFWALKRIDRVARKINKTHPTSQNDHRSDPSPSIA